MVEVDQIDLLLQDEVTEHGAEVPSRVPGVPERSAGEDSTQLGQRPRGPGAGIPCGDDLAPELGTQPACVSAGEIRREDRDLERAVERPEQLERTEGTP